MSEPKPHRHDETSNPALVTLAKVMGVLAIGFAALNLWMWTSTLVLVQSAKDAPLEMGARAGVKEGLMVRPLYRRAVGDPGSPRPLVEGPLMRRRPEGRNGDLVGLRCPSESRCVAVDDADGAAAYLRHFAPFGFILLVVGVLLIVYARLVGSVLGSKVE